VSSVLLTELQQLVSAHGYWVVALIVGLESMGLPLPGETILVLAAIYAATAQGRARVYARHARKTPTRRGGAAKL
jgi:membrane protein DedA with SNARE-associated domain